MVGEPLKRSFDQVVAMLAFPLDDVNGHLAVDRIRSREHLDVDNVHTRRSTRDFDRALDRKLGPLVVVVRDQDVPQIGWRLPRSGLCTAGADEQERRLGATG